MNTFYNIFIKSGTNQIELYGASGLSSSYALALPSVAPANNDLLRWNNTASAFEWVNSSTFMGGGGTVTSVALTAPASEFGVTGSPIVGSGTLALSWAAQSGNKVFAAPANGSSGTPAFRAIVDADLPAVISASKISGQLTKSNIPGGTTATAFQLNNASGSVLSDNSGTGFRIFNADGVTLGDLFCRNINITGTIDQSVATTVNLGDSVLALNSNFTTGTPTADAGLSVKRGASANADLTWVESTDDWQGGINTNMKAFARRHQQSIVNADLTASVYTLNHNLGKYPVIQVLDNTLAAVGVTITHTNVNTATLNFTRVGALTGTWIIVAIG